MFDQIFGNYLVHAGRISKEQFAEVIEYESTVRVKLGLIAVAEKLMTKEQADEVNQLQAIMDKRFGDIAVEKGYLTDEQVGQLLKKQGNI
jgi:aspartate ammonia-lyase